MKNALPLKSAMNFFKKGITLSLLILLNSMASAHTGAPYSKGKDYSTDDCTHTLSVTSRQVGAEAASNQRFRVTITGSCSWTAISNVTWLTITSGERTTSSDVIYSYKANMATAARTGIITVGTQTYTVTQAGRPLTADGYEGATTNNTVLQATLLTPTAIQNTSTITISPANCHNAEDVDYYKINLAAGSYKVSAVLHDSYRPVNNSNYTLDAKISYSIDNGASWSNTEDTQLPELKVLGGMLYLKIEPFYTGGVGSYAAKIDITAGCYFTLSETTKVLTSSQGTRQVNVTTGPSCSWTALSNGAWITITSGSGTGSGILQFSYNENTTTDSRTGTITVDDQTYTLTQASPPDGYEPNNTVIEAWGLTAAFTPQNVSTINISPASCHVSGDVDYYKINLTTDYSYRVSAVLYDRDNPINNSNYTLDAKISYSTNNGTTWSNTADSQFSDVTVSGGDLYLKIVPYSSGNVGSYAAKIDISRLATVGCTYTLSANKSADADAGSDQITVTPTGATACYWAAFSNDAWITITSGASGTGTGSVSYSYNANMATASRTGTITIGGQTYTVTQVGRPLEADGYEQNNTVTDAYPLTAAFTSQNVSTINISPASCHVSGDVDYYKINLAVGSSYRVSALLYDSYNKINNSNYTLNAKIFYSINSGTTWSYAYDVRFSNVTVSGGDLYLKIVPYSSGVGSYAAKIDILKIAADCTYSLSSVSKQAASAAGSDQVTVTTGLTCPCAAVSNDTWITITSAPTTGPGSIQYSYTENTGIDTREGTITIGGQTYTVTQLPRSLTPDGYEQGATTNNTVGNAYPFTPTFTPTLTQNASIINISPANCHNVEDVDYYKINLAAGYSYSVDAVLYDSYNRINNSNYTLDAEISYSTDDGITWSDTEDTRFSNVTVSGDIYLKIEPLFSGYLGSYAAKVDIKRVSVAGCTYELSPTTKAAAADAGSDQITVTRSMASAASCSWAAFSNNNWITITSVASTTNPGSVRYSYDANMATTPRIGTITIGGQTYTVTQVGRPLGVDGYEPNNTVTDAYTLTAAFTPQNVSTINISPASCHISTDVDYYKINLAAGYSYTVGAVLYDGDNQINNSNYTLDVKISYSTDNGTTWSDTQDVRFSNVTVPEETLYLKIVPYSSGNVGSYAAKIDINRVADACSYSLSPASIQVSVATGNASITVTGTCDWAATSDAAWLTVPGTGTGTGTGTIAYTYTANTATTSRVGTIRVGSQSFVVTQAGTCSFTLASSSANVASASGTSTVAVTPTPGSCVWQATSDAAWLTITPSTGDGTITYAYTANTTTASRIGTITVDSQTFVVTQASICSFTLASSSANATSALGTGSVAVTANYTTCSWTATSNVTWITLTSAQSGTGSGSVDYSYTANTELTSRTGTITIGEQTYTVTQAPVPCSFTLPSSSANPTSASGTGSVPFTASRSNCPWTATSNVTWITLTSAQSGTGSGSVDYSYTANTELTSRTGTITIGEQTYTVTQAPVPCSFTLPSSSANPTSASGTGSVPFTASRSNCPWTATSNVSWLTLTSGSGTGSGIGYSYTANTELTSRTGIITIGDQTYTVTQAPVPCSFTLTSSSANVTSASGTSSVPSTASRSNCPWTATSNATWLTLTSGSGTGSGIGYSYTANTELTSRIGIITIGDQTYTVTQAPVPCSFTLTSSSTNVTSALGTGKVLFTASRSNCSWTATSNVLWLTLTSGSGTGSGSVDYSYTANTELSSRTGTITIAGQTFTVSQSAAAAAIVAGFETTGHVQIFPNPAREYVTLDLSSTDKNYASLKIANVFGQVFYERENPQHKMQIPLKGFSSGLYFIILQGGEKAVVQKLIVE